jgi:two-component system phosphate regulon sensor histidine kinase PhoR
MLFHKPQFFPKQLFLRFLVQQVLGVVPVLFLAALAARLYLESRLSNLQTVEQVVVAYDRAFLFLALVMALIVTGISLWTGYRLVLPLGRILVKARSILKRDYSASQREGERLLAEDEKGEWSDLESALHRIGKDMQTKDQTLSREREEIEAILSAISEAVVAVDRAGNLLFYNSQFVVLFGDLQRRQMRLSDFFRNPDVLDAFRTALKEGAPFSVSTRLRLKGEPAFRHFSLSVASLKLESGDAYGAVGVFHDVTELKRMDQVRIDFVANVSHELRTPLTSIKGYAQTLKTDFPEGSAPAKYLATIERNTDRLIALVQDLLSISALESGADMETAEVDLQELTERVVAQLESPRAAKNHQIHLVISTPTLYADGKKIEQVLFNLLENGIKYTANGGNTTVTWEKKSGEVILRVADDGPGIPLEHHARVFERFYRVDSARTREQGGTGLGLSIVKHIVQRHGGKVRLSAGLGKGTEFICSFPAERER